jgi:hypothetical protein
MVHRVCVCACRMDQEEDGGGEELGAFSIDTKQGRKDAYSIGSLWYYVLHTLLIIYGLGYIVSLVLIQNAQVEHTYTKANVYGILHSDRYVSAYWLALVLMTVRPLIFVVVCSLLLYRNTTCCGNKAIGCNAFWVALLVIFVLADLLSFALMSSFYTKCNGIGQVGNPCNSYKWCCASEIYMDATNLCADTVPCIPPLTLAELKPQVDFVWLYSASVAFAAFDIFFLMLPIGLWVVGPTGPPLSDESVIDAEDDLLEEDDDIRGKNRSFPLVQTPALNLVRTARKRQTKKQA